MTALYFVIIVTYSLIIGIMAMRNRIVDFLTLQKNHVQPQTKFSLVIPFKEPIETLKALKSNLPALQYPVDKLEIIIVLDDLPEPKITIAKGHETRQIQILENKYAPGKKNALLTGIEQSSFDYIITSDADCQFHKNWPTSIDQTIQLSGANMVAGSVIPVQDLHGINQKFFALDFLSLQAVSFALNNLGNPGLASGANLCFKKQDFMEIKDQWKAFQTPSGDDVFLIQLFRKYKKKIVWNLFHEGLVGTEMPKTFRAFFNQRARWGAKSAMYPDKKVLLLAVITVLANFCIVLGIPAIYFKLIPVDVFVTGVLLKIFFDAFLLIPFLNKTGFKQLRQLVPVAALVYPFFLSFSALKAIFGNYSWKNKPYSR